MFLVKKRNYVISIIAVLLIGALIGYGVNFLVGGYSISSKDYRDYRNLSDKYGRLIELEAYLEENYYLPLTDEQIETGLYRGLFASAEDPYTVYYTKEEFEKASADAKGELSGVGIIMNVSDDQIKIIELIDGAPAQKAGVKVGDVITKVDDESFNVEDFADVASSLRGDPGTKVSLTVQRNNKEIVFELTRANFKSPTVESEIMEGNIGYIRLSAFSEDTISDFEAALKKMEESKVNGLVIDMRNNDGGFVYQGIKVADLLMDEAVIAYTEDRKGNKEEFKSEEGKTSLEYVVLINENSASTAEIVAAGIKESKSGILVGEKTTGKGIIQQLQQFKEGDGCKITIMQYFTAGGDAVHEAGIKPDYIVENTDSTDKQLNKAIELLKN